MKYTTLYIRKPFGSTVGISLIILITFTIAFEVSLRSDFVAPFLSRLIPSLGGNHLQMEEQLTNLEKFAVHEGKVDCIFLGSSLVWLGVNPPVFEEIYKRETGQNIRCYNLGVETLPANAASALATVAVEHYKPWLLVYGTSARDYAIGSQEEDSRVVLDTLWLQYQLGHITPRTWLQTHSYFLQYKKDLSNLLRMDDDTWGRIRYNAPTPRGFLGKTKPAQPVHFEAGEKDAARWFHPFEVQPENLEGLTQIVNQQIKGSQIIVVEMPVSQHYYDYFERGKEDYDLFVNQVNSLLTSEGAIFLRPPSDDLISEEGWWDYSHMNLQGANIFTEWLAERVSSMVKAGTLEAPVVVVNE